MATLTLEIDPGPRAQIPWFMPISSAIDPETKSIHYRRAGIKHVEAETSDWLPLSGSVRVGLTAGASTPNNKIGEAIVRILATRGLDPE